MTETINLKLPLVAAAQAQKHVTVNEALSRIDAALHLSVLSRHLSTPPVASAEGECYLIPPNASAEWGGFAGDLAFFVNGGWDFITPKVGWRIWITDETRHTFFDGVTWSDNIMALSPHGAASRFDVLEQDLIVENGGGIINVADAIPGASTVFAITGRIIEGFDGDLSSWSLGLQDAPDRYGSGFGISQGAWLRGITGQPLTYYNDTELRLSAAGGAFGNGVVRLSVHLMQFDLPRGN